RQDLSIQVVDDQAMHVESVCVAGRPARFEFGIEANMRGRQQTETGETVTFGSKNFAHKYSLWLSRTEECGRRELNSAVSIHSFSSRYTVAIAAASVLFV